MESKKNPKADINNKSTLFFSISFLFTMLIVVTAFEWKNYDKSIIDLQGKNIDSFDETMEVPPTEQPPPPEPVVQQPQVVEVPDEEEIKEEIKINMDIEVTEETKVQELIIEAEEPKEDTDQIFTVVEESASPKGGMKAFYKYVGDKVKYPAQARRMGIEGKVYVQFVINKNGSITDVKVIKGIGAGCDEEAKRILEESPSWNPGKQRGKPVRQKYTLPIIFKLG